MPRIAVATQNGNGLDDVVADRFGRAPFFTIVDLDDKGNIVNVKVVENPGAKAHGGAGVKAVQKLVDEKVEVAVGPSFGPNAKAVLDEVGIKTITTTPGRTVREVVEEVKKKLGLA